MFAIYCFIPDSLVFADVTMQIYPRCVTILFLSHLILSPPDLQLHIRHTDALISLRPQTENLPQVRLLFVPLLTRFNLRHLAP